MLHTVYLAPVAPRDNNGLQQANRKLERKVKEMKMHADEEHINLKSERDQVQKHISTLNRNRTRKTRDSKPHFSEPCS